MRRIHHALAPVETVVDLDRLARTFDVPLVGARATWEPRFLPRVLDYLPEQTPLGLYGRGPNWLYAAVALRPYPQAFYQFDVRLGWITPQPLRLGRPAPEAPLRASVSQRAGHAWAEFHIPAAHLDYEEALNLTVPEPPSESGMILSGKLPHWIYTALALTYAPHVAWLAVYQPPLDRAVVVSSTGGSPGLGEAITVS